MHYKVILESSGEHVATANVTDQLRIGENIQLQLNGEETVCLVTRMEPGIENVGNTFVIGTVWIRRVV